MGLVAAKRIRRNRQPDEPEWAPSPQTKPYVFPGQAPVGEIGNSEFGLPARQHGFRCAPTRAGVDGRGAADGAAEGNRNVGVADRSGEAPLAVERSHLGQGFRGEVATAVLPALFEHHDLPPRFGQLGGDNGTAGPGSHDDDACAFAEARGGGSFERLPGLDSGIVEGNPFQGVDVAESRLDLGPRIELRECEELERAQDLTPGPEAGRFPGFEDLFALFE